MCVFALFRSLSKHLENLTSETYSHEVKESLNFPSVSLCPIFKHGKISVAESNFPPTIQSLGLLDFSHLFDKRYAVFITLPPSCPNDILYVRNVTRSDFNDTSIFVPIMINNIGSEEVFCFTYNPPEPSRVGLDMGAVS